MLLIFVLGVSEPVGVSRVLIQPWAGGWLGAAVLWHR